MSMQVEARAILGLTPDPTLCPICKASTQGLSFRDELSAREFQISGLCQSCQDTIFGG